MDHWIAQADQTAYACIVQRFAGMALAVAYEKLRDWHLAEDPVQEAFAEAFANLAKLAKAGGISRDVSADYQRRK